MEWSNDKVLEFIQNYKAEPILWNPQETGHKKKQLNYEAWVRIKNNLDWPVTMDELKKKKDSLMAYYRTHLKKYKKSVKPGAGTDDIYQTNWFAFAAMNNFLGPIYDCPSNVNEQIGNENEDLDNYDDEVKENSSDMSEKIIYVKSMNDENDRFRNITSNTKREGKKRTKTHLPSEVIAARQQVHAFEDVENSNDEYDTFAKFIAIKLKKIKNPNTCDILMNDIHDLIFRAAMKDRHEQSLLPQYCSTNAPSPDPIPCNETNETSPSTSQSPHH